MLDVLLHTIVNTIDTVPFPWSNWIQDVHLDYETNYINGVGRASHTTSSLADANVGTLCIGLGGDGVL